MIYLPRACARHALSRTPLARSPPQHSQTAARIVCRPHITRAQVPEQSKTIPTPTTWLWLEPVTRPFRAYGRVQQRRPYMTQFVSALVIYFVGDLVAQGIGGSADAVAPVEGARSADAAGEGEDEDEDEEMTGWVQAWVEDRDWARTGRALFIGGLAAVPGYRWFLWLGNNFNYSSKVLSLTTKVLVNQTFFTPIFNTYFFGLQSLLSGAPLPDTLTRVQNTVPVSVKNSWKLWPAVTAFMFAFVPVQYRNIFGGTIAIGWQTYLSLLNQRAAREEGAETAAPDDAKVVHVEVRGAEKGGEGRCVA